MNNRQPRFKEGDLVHWSVGPHGTSFEAGIVLEVFPSNVYEPESCLILCGHENVVIDSKHLSTKEKIL